MSSDPIPLSNRQIGEFIANGFVILKSSLPPEFHAKVREILGADSDTPHNFDNNLVPRYPVFHELFEEPVVRGAVASVLGDDFVIQPHRHGHTSYRRTVGELDGWHKDSYWGYHKIRRQRPWMAMLMYYPQETTLALGPTRVVAGSQRLLRNPLPGANEDNADAPYVQVHQTFPEGTLLLIDYHIWHAASTHDSDQPRYMVKVEFSRQTPPVAREAGPMPLPKSRPYHDQHLAWQQNWNWLHGQSHTLPSRPSGARQSVPAALKSLAAEDAETRLKAVHSLVTPEADTPEVAAALAQRLGDRREAVAQEAAQALAALPANGLARLAEVLGGEDEALAQLAAQALACAGPDAVPLLVQALASPQAHSRAAAAYALGEYPDSVTDGVRRGLLRAAADPELSVRMHALESIGLLGDSHAHSVEALCKAVREDAEQQARWAAAWSLLRLAPKLDAGAVQESLLIGMRDENRYVRYYCLDTMSQLPDAAAREVARRHLLYSRWCTTTDGGHPFYP